MKLIEGPKLKHDERRSNAGKDSSPRLFSSTSLEASSVVKLSVSVAGAILLMEIISLNLCYANLERSDWLLESFQPIRMLQNEHSVILNDRFLVAHDSLTSYANVINKYQINAITLKYVMYSFWLKLVT